MIKPQNLKSLSIRNGAELSANLVLKDLQENEEMAIMFKLDESVT